MPLDIGQILNSQHSEKVFFIFRIIFCTSKIQSQSRTDFPVRGQGLGREGVQDHDPHGTVVGGDPRAFVSFDVLARSSCAQLGGFCSDKATIKRRRFNKAITGEIKF